MRNKKKIIPKSNIDFNVDDTKSGGISAADASLISNVHNFFEMQGVIDREVEFKGAESIDEVAEILSEASSVSLSEADINPEFYDERVSNLLDGLIGVDNRVLDSYDEYDD